MTRFHHMATFVVAMGLALCVSPATAQTPVATPQTRNVPTSATGMMTPAQMAARKRALLLAQHADSGGTGEAAWQLMKRPMDLPDLPKYTGQAEFVEGLMYPNKPGGPAIVMKFRAKEEPDSVLSWYSDSLKQFTWKLEGSHSGKNITSIKAQHGKNGCSILVLPAKDKIWKTDLRISYKLAK